MPRMQCGKQENRKKIEIKIAVMRFIALVSINHRYIVVEIKDNGVKVLKFERKYLSSSSTKPREKEQVLVKCDMADC